MTADFTAPTSGLKSMDEYDERILGQTVRRRRIQLSAWRLGIVGAVLVLWQVATISWVDPFWMSRPTSIAAVLGDWITSGYLVQHVYATFEAMIIGLLLGSVLGIVTGLVLGQARTVALVLDPLISALYAVPRIALAPLFILWFGIGLLPKVLLTASIVFFLTFRSTFEGVISVDEGLLNTVRLMGAKKRHLWTKVLLPSSLNWIFAGLRLSVPYALIGAVVAEFVAATEGIGWTVRNAAGVLDTDTVFAGLVVLSFIGFVLDRLVAWAETVFSRWRHQDALAMDNF